MRCDNSALLKKTFLRKHFCLLAQSAPESAQRSRSRCGRNKGITSKTSFMSREAVWSPGTSVISPRITVTTCPSKLSADCSPLRSRMRSWRRFLIHPRICFAFFSSVLLRYHPGQDDYNCECKKNINVSTIGAKMITIKMPGDYNVGNFRV